MNESWKAVVGWEGFYEVSDEGRVRSVDRVVYGRTLKGRLLTLGTHKFGYRTAMLWRHNRGKLCNVHSLVLEAFVGPRPAGQVACHGREGANVNTPGNLRWGTSRSNSLDMWRDGTVRARERGTNARLTEEIISRIKELRPAHTLRALGEMFGCSHSHINNICRGKSWKDGPCLT